MKIEVPIGEVFDKLSILLIKLIKIQDTTKIQFVKTEFTEIINNNDFKECKGIDRVIELIDVNSQLWNVEDNIRIKESKKEFDEDFIKLARKVYVLNDKRFEIKKEINILNNSKLNEVKSYQKYN